MNIKLKLSTGNLDEFNGYFSCLFWSLKTKYPHDITPSTVQSDHISYYMSCVLGDHIRGQILAVPECRILDDVVLVNFCMKDI